jgi:predicted HTH domain antitoxin
MTTVQIDLPTELLRAANVQMNSFAVAKLLALELFREDLVSLGRAAELCGAPLAEFMEFAAERDVPLHYTEDDFTQDRQFIESLSL